MAYPAVRLPLAEHSPDCQDLYHYDPLLSGVNCDREILSLRKIMNARQWREEPDLAYLFQSWNFGNNDIRYLLKYHANSGGNYSTVESASCAWLKDHFDTWGPWVQISDPCGTDGSLVWDNETKLCIEPLSSSNRLLTAPVLSPMISAVVVAIAVFLLFMVRSQIMPELAVPPYHAYASPIQACFLNHSAACFLVTSTTGGLAKIGWPLQSSGSQSPLPSLISKPAQTCGKVSLRR